MHIHHFKVLCISKRYKIPVFRALVPEQLEPEHSQLLGRGAKRTGFEVGSKSFINMHKQPNISVRALRTISCVTYSYMLWTCHVLWNWWLIELFIYLLWNFIILLGMHSGSVVMHISKLSIYAF